MSSRNSKKEEEDLEVAKPNYDDEPTRKPDWMPGWVYTIIKVVWALVMLWFFICSLETLR
jgi:hypothetical protein